MGSQVAVIQFPGSNCERETVVSLEAASLSVDIVSWNTPEDALAGYAAFVLPGGFSFQDRVRAGVVSSKLPIMRVLIKAAEAGIPVLGICNGCQILAEAGLVPNYGDDRGIEMALAPNMNGDKAYGFVCDWVYVTIQRPESCVFTTRFSAGDVLPIPINHGEGNFKFKSGFSLSHLETSFIQYCSETGDVKHQFPTNPNGADFNMAGISNKQGNVLALMPHPERASFGFQVPRYLDNDFSAKKRNDCVQSGPWMPMFESLADYLKEQV